jgi:hypothetical protein
MRCQACGIGLPAPKGLCEVCYAMLQAIDRPYFRCLHTTLGLKKIDAGLAKKRGYGDELRRARTGDDAKDHDAKDRPMLKLLLSQWAIKSAKISREDS